MAQIIWTPEMEDKLRALYPFETNETTADLLGVSRNSVIRKANELGLVKFYKSDWLKYTDIVRDNFNERSISEIARMCQISRAKVQRIAKALGLKKTDRERFQMLSRVRKEQVKSERRRCIFGFEPQTKIKVVTNRARIRYRSHLKSLGYIVVGRNARTLYYTADFQRNEKKEAKGMLLNLSFEPWKGDFQKIAI